MKKIELWVVAGIVLLVLGCASSEKSSPAGEGGKNVEKSPFRNTQWGMSREQVEKAEKTAVAVISPKADELVYDGTLLGKIPVRITYHFQDGRLRRGTYRVTDPGSIMEYTIFRLVLGRKYGKPFNEARTPDLVQMSWLTPETEVDLLGEGTNLDRYSLQTPGASQEIKLSFIKINYYDRRWFGHSVEETEKAEADVDESEKLYRQLIGDWVEIYPSYRDYMDGAMMLEPGETYVYDPEFYDDF
ncbi:MAG: hypothetical protein V1789_03470 [PVC group bacterium]